MGFENLLLGFQVALQPYNLGLAMIGALFQPGAGRVDAQAPPDEATLRQRASEGERALAEGRYADAEAAYEALRRLTPGTGEVHARLGLIYFQQGKFAEATSAYEKIVQSGSVSAGLYFNLGNARERASGGGY